MAIPSTQIVHTSLGPFGGVGGGSWDDGVNTTITQIEIYAGEIIDSFRIQYEKNGTKFWSEKRGQSSGGDKFPIELKSPSEYVISISGYHMSYGSGTFRGHVVSSLKVTTNKETYGPFGIEKGNPFSIHGGKVVGLHGKSGTYVDAIGGYVVPIPQVIVPSTIVDHTIIGPFGGVGGGFWDDGVNTTIKKIEIFAGEIIDSFRVEYEKDGNSFWADKHGQSTGGDRSFIELDWPNEYVISVSGYHMSYGSGTFRGHIVSSLKITTNNKIYGPIGNERGNAFIIQGGKVVGLHGKSGTYVDSIGGYVVPISIPRKHEIIEAYGGLEGSAWDDGVNSGVKTIKIAHDGDVIHSIHTEYEKNGNFIWSEKHGESIDGQISLVELDHPEEYITSVTGYFTDYSKGNFNGFIIASLVITTNKRTWGPYGKEQGGSFSIIPKSGEKIVGLHGKSSSYIDSIGAYTIPISENQN